MYAYGIIVIEEERERERWGLCLLTTKFGYRHLIWFADQISNKRVSEQRRGDPPLGRATRYGFGFGLSHEYSSSYLQGDIETLVFSPHYI